MKSPGLTLSDQLQEDDLKIEGKSSMKTFNYFDYPSYKAKEKPFSSFSYSLDEEMNIAVQQDNPQDNKYQEIIEQQQKLINMFKQENYHLKQKIQQLEQTPNLIQGYQAATQQAMSICYLLNIQCHSEFIYQQIYQAVQNMMNQLVKRQLQVKELEKKLKQNGSLNRVNSTTYIQRPNIRDYKNKKGVTRYKQKQEITYIQQLQRQVRNLKSQCEKLKSVATPSIPLFVPSIKQKRIEVMVQKQKIIEKVVQKEVIIQKPVYIQRVVERPTILQKIVQRPVYFQKKVKQEVPVYIQKMVEKLVPVYVDRQIEVQKVIYLRKQDGRQLSSTCSQTQE